MSALKSPTFSKPRPSNPQNPQGKIPASELKSLMEENRRGRTKTPETHNVYENTGG